MIAVGIVLRYLHWLELFESCLLFYFIVTLIGIMLQMAYISDVAHVAHFVAQVLEIAEKDVKRDSRACMAQMWITIDGRSTNIHAHVGCMQGLEDFLMPRERVVNP